jgi:hypothetical protein
MLETFIMLGVIDLVGKALGSKTQAGSAESSGVTSAQIHQGVAGAHNLGLEAMKNGDEEMAYYWLKYSRELRAKL